MIQNLKEITITSSCPIKSSFLSSNGLQNLLIMFTLHYQQKMMKHSLWRVLTIFPFLNKVKFFRTKSKQGLGITNQDSTNFSPYQRSLGIKKEKIFKGFCVFLHVTLAGGEAHLMVLQLENVLGIECPFWKQVRGAFCLLISIELFKIQWRIFFPRHLREGSASN